MPVLDQGESLLAHALRARVFLSVRKDHEDVVHLRVLDDRVPNGEEERGRVVAARNAIDVGVRVGVPCEPTPAVVCRLVLAEQLGLARRGEVVDAKLGHEREHLVRELLRAAFHLLQIVRRETRRHVEHQRDLALFDVGRVHPHARLGVDDAVAEHLDVVFGERVAGITEAAQDELKLLAGSWIGAAVVQ